MQYAGSYVILLISRLRQSPARSQCLRSLLFDERFLLRFKRFLFLNVLKRF